MMDFSVGSKPATHKPHCDQAQTEQANHKTESTTPPVATTSPEQENTVSTASLLKQLSARILETYQLTENTPDSTVHGDTNSPSSTSETNSFFESLEQYLHTTPKPTTEYNTYNGTNNKNPSHNDTSTCNGKAYSSNSTHDSWNTENVYNTPSSATPPTTKPNASTDKPTNALMSMLPDALYDGRPQLPDGSLAPDSAWYVRNAAKKLDAADIDFAYSLNSFRMNSQYWTPVSGSPGEFRINDGVTASDAINDIFYNSDKYSADCRTQTSMAMYKGVLDAIGSNKFDALYSNNDNFTIGPFTSMQFSPSTASGSDIPLNEYGEVDWNYVQPGSYVYFDNPNVSPEYARLWQGENAIFLGFNENDKPIFSAQGIENNGEPITIDAIMNHLNARSDGGGAQVTLIWDM